MSVRDDYTVGTDKLMLVRGTLMNGNLTMGKYELERSLEINAPLRVIWDELLDINSWPEWKPMIAKVAYDGDKLEPGTKFKFNIRVKGPFATPVTCKVLDVDFPKKMAWTGGLQGLSVSVHSFLFEERGEKTLVISREEFTGALVGLMLLFVTRKDLDKLHDDWLVAIRQRVENNKL